MICGMRNAQQTLEDQGMPPSVVRRECGGWLAYSRPRALIRIGVTADTEAEARERYIRAIDRWGQILEGAA